MFMQKIIISSLFWLSTILIQLSCYSENIHSVYPVNILDTAVARLNGTWTSPEITAYIQANPADRKNVLNQQFSWGMGKVIPSTTLDIDLENNALNFEELRGFNIKEIEVIDASSVLVRAISGDLELYFKNNHISLAKEEKRFTNFTFHFSNPNKFWIECKELQGMLEVGKDVFWTRLSGPK